MFFPGGTPAGSCVCGDTVAADTGEPNFSAPPGAPRLPAPKTSSATPRFVPPVLLRLRAVQGAGAGPPRVSVETASLPGRTGGLVDTYHLTHYGSIFLGVWVAVTDFFTP
jgi:hypothetical protein